MLFPTLRNGRFGYVDYNAYAERLFGRFPPDGSNPFLDPASADALIAAVHRELAIGVSYGGWLEDRSVLLRGSYLDATGNYLHLGVDFSVPAGTPVAVDFPARVVLVDSDYPEEGGWGRRVILRPQGRDEVVIYAHLNPKVSCKEGQALPQDAVFAAVGAPPHNGGWFQHLHVQRVDLRFFESMRRDGRLHEIDGYGHPSQRPDLANVFRDPLPLLRLPG